MKIQFIAIIMLFSFALTAQNNLKLLKRTGNPDFYQASGLSQSFSGQVLDDGKLYFKTTVTSFDDYIWVTDGTTDGTHKIYSESDFNRFEYLVYDNEGIYIIDKNDEYSLYFYDIYSEAIELVAGMSDFSFFEVAEADEYDLLFGYNDNDKVEIWLTDKTESGTYSLGEAGDYHFNLEFSGSAYGSVLYNSNPWVDYVPRFIDIQKKEIISLIDFLAPYKTLDDINRAYIHDNLLMLGVVEDGWQRNYIFDLATSEFHESTFINDVEKVIDYKENECFVFTSNDLLHIDKTTMVSEKIFDDVYPFSYFLVDEDRLFFINDLGWNYETNHIFYIDMTDRSIHELNDTDIGASYYGCQMAIHEGNLYYTQKEYPDILLWKYDMDNMEKTMVDTVAVNNNGYVINNGLIKVGSHLLTSRYERENGHELYYLDWTSGLVQASIAIYQLTVFPNPSADYIEFESIEPGNYEIIIVDNSGKIVLYSESFTKRLDITNLAKGHYHGMITGENNRRVFSFIRK